MTLAQHFTFGDRDHIVLTMAACNRSAVRDLGDQNDWLDSDDQPTSMLARARRYRDFGFSLVPRAPNRRSQLQRSAAGRRREANLEALPGTSPTDDRLRRWFGGGSGRGAGLVLRELIVGVDGDSLDALAWMKANLPDTAKTRTGRGEHWFFRRPLNVDIPAEIRVTDTLRIEIKQKTQYLVSPGSRHPSGVLYEEIEPWPADFRALPYLPEIVVGKREVGTPAEALSAVVPDGSRNNTLFREGCRARRLGWDEPEILAALREINHQRCHPPLDVREVESIAKGCARYRRSEGHISIYRNGRCGILRRLLPRHCPI